MRFRYALVSLGAVVALGLGGSPPVQASAQGTHARDISHAAGVRVEKVKLRSCSGLERLLGSSCEALHYSLGSRPSGRNIVKAEAFSDGTWRWDDQICAPAGCWLWWVDLAEGGSYIPYVSVTEYIHDCKAAGYGVQITMCSKLLDNGGGDPFQGILWGMDYQTCFAPFGLGCSAHGLRRWFTNNGSPGNMEEF